MPDSLWTATSPGIEAFPRHTGDSTADVAIIGGGFMGLSAALALAETGANVTLLEAAEIGWGASGRNNGLLAPGLKRDPDEVRGLLGSEAADRLLRLAGDAPATVFELVEKHGIRCAVNRRGWIQAAHAKQALPLIEARVRSWRALGADVELIPADQVTERLGTSFYAGAWLDRRGGSLNPLAYARGLALAARQSGARLHERSPAVSIDKAGNGWVVTTDSGRVRSEQVICCTNAYGDALPGMRGLVIPLRTAQVASAPLDPEQAQSILPGGESASDTQRLLTSFRLTADDRLIMGGASATAGDEVPGLFRHLHRAARERVQQLG